MTGETPATKRIRSPRELLRALMQLDDTEHSIALGTAIGMFYGLTPTVGIQMIMVMVTAGLTRKLFRFNVMAALIAVYVSNPITLVPIYWMLYKVGTFFVEGNVSREQFSAILEYDGFAEWWDTIVDLFVGIGEPLLIGTAIVAIPGGLLTYPAMRWLLRWFRGSEANQNSAGVETAQENNES